jgi:bacterioferritin-associated ferredoxin
MIPKLLRMPLVRVTIAPYDQACRRGGSGFPIPTPGASRSGNMYVCLCKGIRDKDIRQAVESGVQSMRELRKRLPVASQCGRCGRCAREVLLESLHEFGGLPLEVA